MGTNGVQREHGDVENARNVHTHAKGIRLRLMQFVSACSDLNGKSQIKLKRKRKQIMNAM